jgi:mono/diheme cytochrome c family protein
MKRYITSFIVIVGIFVVGAGTFIYSGLYDIGADAPHWPFIKTVIETLRTRSIERHAQDIKVPDLQVPELLSKGAGQYAAMCVQCHLAPGKSDSEIRPGLYPQPPDLSKVRVDPREAFWAIKHGVKMSAMPAWGLGHDDATIWSIVAFVNKLPDMSSQDYSDMVAKAPPDEEMESMDHKDHGSGKNSGDEKKSDKNMKSLTGK